MTTLSVSNWPRAWTAEGSEFASQYGQDFCLLHVVQTGSGAHPASYPTSCPMGTWGGGGPGGKGTRARRSLASKSFQDQEYVDLYIHSPYAFMV
jgi:hypothetical protein